MNNLSIDNTLGHWMSVSSLDSSILTEKMSAAWHKNGGRNYDTPTNNGKSPTDPFHIIPNLNAHVSNTEFMEKFEAVTVPMVAGKIWLAELIKVVFYALESRSLAILTPEIHSRSWFALRGGIMLFIVVSWSTLCRLRATTYPGYKRNVIQIQCHSSTKARTFELKGWWNRVQSHYANMSFQNTLCVRVCEFAVRRINVLF